LIAERHREDWRNLRLLDEAVQPYRVAVNRLATQLLDVPRDRHAAAPMPAAERSKDDEGEGEDLSDHVPSAPLEPAYSGDVEERGIMELLAEGEEALPRLVETLNSISPQIERVGELARSATEEVNDSDSSGKGFRGRLTIMNRLAKRLADPADELEKLTSRYAADLLVLDPAMKQLIRLLKDQTQDDPESAEEFFDSVRVMVKGSSEAAENIQHMIDSFTVPQSFSRELAAPLKRMRVSLQSMIDGNEMMTDWEAQIDGDG
jgi:hypothetical protein